MSACLRSVDDAKAVYPQRPGHVDKFDDVETAFVLFELRHERLRPNAITASHWEKSGADAACGQGSSTERVQVSWHDRQGRCLRAGGWPGTGGLRDANDADHPLGSFLNYEEHWRLTMWAFWFSVASRRRTRGRPSLNLCGTGVPALDELLRARGARRLDVLIVRRFDLAWRAFCNGPMPAHHDHENRGPYWLSWAAARAGSPRAR
jgi:hypothetical protein